MCSLMIVTLLTHSLCNLCPNIFEHSGGHTPGQKGVEIVWSCGVRAEGRRGDVSRSLGPVLAPIVRAIRTQTGWDGLPIHHSTCRADGEQGQACVQQTLFTIKYTLLYRKKRDGHVCNCGRSKLVPFFLVWAMTSAALLLITLVT